MPQVNSTRLTLGCKIRPKLSPNSAITLDDAANQPKNRNDVYNLMFDDID